VSNSLALKYRPASFADLVGQKPVQLVLQRMLHDRQGNPLEEHAVPHGLLLTGGRGSGKTSTARILAAALNCEEPCRRPCGKCPSCEAVASGRNLDVMEIDAASNGGVAEIRKLRESVSYAPAGLCRVVILDEAHSMSRDAFNSLLKILEEPPEHTVFILITTDVTKIPETVASRCTPFAFRRIPPEIIVKRLQMICGLEEITAEPALLEVIAERAQGGLRDAINLLDQVQRVGITTLRHYEVLNGETDFAPLLIAAMSDGDAGTLFARLEHILSQTGDYQLVTTQLAWCLRDILVLGAGGSVQAQGEALSMRQALAHRLSAHAVAAALRVLWSQRCQPPGEPRSGLDLAVVMCMEKLCPRQPQPAPYAGPDGHANGNGRVPLDLDEMRRLAAR
jgi:DNA polymerase III subunit gamma/tau